MQIHIVVRIDVLSEEGDRQHLLRAMLRLAKHPNTHN